MPTKLNPLGAKGAGEAGTVGALPVVINAVMDALAPLGVRDLDMPATSDRVWRAIQDARRRSPLAPQEDDPCDRRSTTPALDLLLRNARTQNGWLPTPVSDDQLREIYDIMQLGPDQRQLLPGAHRCSSARRRPRPG